MIAPNLSCPPHSCSLNKISNSICVALGFIPTFLLATPLPPEFQTINVTFPESVNFDDNTGFEIRNQPEVNWDVVPWTEKTLKPINKDTAFIFTKDPWSSSDKYVVLPESDFEWDAQNHSLRFFQDCRSGEGIIGLKKNTELTIKNITDFQAYAENPDVAVLSSNGASLNIQANNIWLQTNAYSDVRVLEASGQSRVNLEAANNFVALYEVRGKTDNPLRMFYTSGQFNLNANNVYVRLENTDQSIQSDAFYFLSASEVNIGSYDEPVNLFYVDGVGSAITFQADKGSLHINADNIVLNLKNPSKQPGSNTGWGIGSSVTTDIRSQFIEITGSPKAIYLNDESAKTITVTGEGIYIDSQGVLDFYGKNYGVYVDSEATNADKREPVKLKTTSFYIKDTSTGIYAVGRSAFELEASNLYIENTIGTGEQALDFCDSQIKIDADSIVLKGYESGLYSAWQSQSYFPQPNLEIKAENNILIHDSHIGMFLEGAKASLKAENLQVNANERFGDSSAIVGLKGASVELDVNETIEVNGFQTAIYAENSAVKVSARNLVVSGEDDLELVSIKNNSEAELLSTEKAYVNGDVIVENSKLNMQLGSDSYYNGSTNLNGQGELNLTLGENSLWRISSPSNLSTLNSRAATIEFSNIGSEDFPNLVLDKLNGQGNTFVLQANSNLDSISFISLGKETTEQNTQFVQFADGLNLAPSEELSIQFAEDESGNVTFIAGQSVVDAGLFVLTPELSNQVNGNGKSWFITNIKQEPAPTPVAMIEGIENNYFFWRTISESTKERFGQLRHGSHTGAWARVSAGSLSRSHLDNDYQSYRFGTDTSVQPDFFLGAMFEVHDGDLKTPNGNGDSKTLSWALYGLWMSENGFYTDGGFRVGVMDYDYDNHSLLPDKYSYSSVGINLWLELGKEWTFGGQYLITPHVSVNYGRFGTENFKTQNGIKADVSSVDSLIFSLGTDFGINGDKFSCMLTLDAKTEIAGRSTVSIRHNTSEIKKNYDFSDTWLETGLFASYRPSNSSQMWANVKRSAFADINEEWRLNLGLEVQF